jgi:hypothetical protein
MTAPQFIQQAIAEADALSDVGIADSRGRVDEAHHAMRTARARLLDARDAEALVDDRQAERD